MIARALISAEITPLKTSSTGDEALSMMGDFHIRHLPIVNDEQLLGLISEEEIYEFDAHEAVGSYSLKMSQPYVHDRDHIYEIMRILHLYRLTLVPVVDKGNNYLGVVTLPDLLKFFAESASFAENGSVIVLSVTRNNYSLAQIARIVESEGAQILNSFITSKQESTELEITLKINRQDINAVMATFQRFGYDVEASFSEAEYIESLQANYDAFLHYLNV
jgi:acetoin utilization protein AcuB